MRFNRCERSKRNCEVRFSLSLPLGRVCFQSCVFEPPKFFWGFCLLAALVWDYGPKSSQFCQWDLDFGEKHYLFERLKFGERIYWGEKKKEGFNSNRPKVFRMCRTNTT